MPEKLNIVCRDNGECISIVHPGTGCTDVIGVGHAGAMSYYRVRYNKSFALKISKTCVSSNDICNPARSLLLVFKTFGDCQRGWEFARNIMHNVKPTRNPFTASFLAEHPEFA